MAIFVRRRRLPLLRIFDPAERQQTLEQAARLRRAFGIGTEELVIRLGSLLACLGLVEDERLPGETTWLARGG